MEEADTVELTPDMLDAYLRILRENEVQEFMGMGICIKFFPESPEPESVKAEPARVHKSMWENESLWPGGSPPEFQKKPK